MKKIVIAGLILSLSIGVKAQTFKEWFEQKKTQIEYLVNQIGALKVYTSTIEKGYSIAHEGLSAIGNIRKGDFTLHSEYFSSLGKVNPQIKSYWKIADIIQTEIQVLKTCDKQKKLLNNSGEFTSDETHYCSLVFSGLLEGCIDIIDQLMVITADGKLEMSDDERIRRIDALHKRIKEREKFIQSFGSEVSLLFVQRVKDRNDVKVLKGLFDIR